MKSILFKPWKIKAIADSSLEFEWQTRRLGGLEEINKEPDEWCEPYVDTSGHSWLFLPKGHTGGIMVKSRYQVGDVLYIKEGIHRFNKEYASYDSDSTPVMFLGSANRFHWRWQRDKLSPMFLPAEAARYFIRIISVRPERLQEITEEDCKAEGIIFTTVWVDRFTMRALEDSTRKVLFQELWDSINPKHPFANNDWIWRYEFKKVEKDA